MELKNLERLFIHELQDLYSAENQLLQALPKMADAASTNELKQGFEKHHKQTQEHVQRLEQIFQDLNQQPGDEKCEGMEGLIEEGEEILTADGEKAVKDAALIAAAQRVEHYEISGYGTARTYAQHLGNDKARDLLQRTLEEESRTDEELTHLAEQGPHINEMAMQ